MLYNIYSCTSLSITFIVYKIIPPGMSRAGLLMKILLTVINSI